MNIVSEGHETFHMKKIDARDSILGKGGPERERSSNGIASAQGHHRVKVKAGGLDTNSCFEVVIVVPVSTLERQP
jgi:hypothetical protein